MSSSTITGEPVPNETVGVVERAAVAELLDRFILALDGHDFDDAWLGSVVTDDVTFEFPLGRHQGIDGLASFLERPMAVFERTHHQCSHAVVDVAGERATLTANMIATHVHHPDHRDGDAASEPGPLVMFGTHLDGVARETLVIGTHMDGEARRTAAGWRLQRLTFRLSWILGEPPTPRAPADDTEA
jgi:hypothetical protein